jgi:tetratricopeptide (TPR) repeat protein
MKKNGRVIADLTKATFPGARYAKAYDERGAVNIALARYDEAIKDFSTANSINPNVLQFYK